LTGLGDERPRQPTKEKGYVLATKMFEQGIGMGNDRNLKLREGEKGGEKITVGFTKKGKKRVSYDKIRQNEKTEKGGNSKRGKNYEALKDAGGSEKRERLRRVIQKKDKGTPLRPED